MGQQLAGSHLACLARWRRIVATHPCRGANTAAIAFRCQKSPVNGLVPIEQMSAALLQVQATRHGPFPLQFRIYSACAVAFGLEWGGVHNSRVVKDLRIRPRLAARGKRMSLSRPRSLRTSLDLFEAIVNADVCAVNDHIQIPQCWMGFDPCIEIEGDGPELSGMVNATGTTAAELMIRTRRDHNGLAVYPMEWTSHCWAEAKEIFVEPDSVPLIQVVRCVESDETLIGFRGACSFDFHSSAFPDPHHSFERWEEAIG